MSNNNNNIFTSYHTNVHLCPDPDILQCPDALTPYALVIDFTTSTHDRALYCNCPGVCIHGPMHGLQVFDPIQRIRYLQDAHTYMQRKRSDKILVVYDKDHHKYALALSHALTSVLEPCYINRKTVQPKQDIVSLSMKISRGNIGPILKNNFVS